MPDILSVELQLSGLDRLTQADASTVALTARMQKMEDTIRRVDAASQRAAVSMKSLPTPATASVQQAEKRLDQVNEDPNSSHAERLAALQKVQDLMEKASKTTPVKSVPGPVEKLQRAQQQFSDIQGKPEATQAQRTDSLLHLTQAADSAEKALLRLSKIEQPEKPKLADALNDYLPQKEAGSKAHKDLEKLIPVGTAQRVEKAGQGVYAAQRGGDPSKVFDAQRVFARAEASHHREQRAAGTIPPLPPKPTKEPAPPPGPMATLEKARLQYAEARRSKDPARIFDAGFRMKQAEKHVDTAKKAMEPEKSPAMKALTNAVLSSRYAIAPGGKPNLSPLIGKSLMALEALGPFGVAVGIAASSLELFHNVTESAAKNLSDFGKGQLASGGSVAEQSALRSLGGMTGMSGEDMANMARTFQERISPGGNPVAETMFNQHDYGSNYGFTDTASELLAATKTLRLMEKSGNDAGAIRAARAGGVERLLPVARLSDKDWDLLMKDAADSTKIYTRAQQEGAESLDNARGRLSTAWDDLITRIGKPFIAPLAEGENTVATGMRVAGQMIEKGRKNFEINNMAANLEKADAVKDENKGDYLSAIQKRFEASNTLTFGAAPPAKYLQQAEAQYKSTGQGEGVGAKVADDAMNDFAKALDRNMPHLDNLRNIYGGGPMAHGAIPQAWRGPVMQQALPQKGQTLTDMWNAQAFTLGALR